MTLKGSWDTEVGGPTDAYSSCLYFDNVPFKYYDEDNVEKNENVFIYAIFKDPIQKAAQRPDKADFFIMEFYDPELHKHTTWFPHKNPPESFRFMAEDLGQTDDWDFNDLVVDVSAVLTNIAPIYGDGHTISANCEDYYADNWLVSTLGHNYAYKVTATPRASGGIFPIYFVYDGSLFLGSADISDLKGKKVSELMTWTPEQLAPYVTTSAERGKYVVGSEMHHWLGSDATDKMINTRVITNTGESVTFYTEGYSSNDFLVIVDKDNLLEYQPVDGMGCSLITKSEGVITYDAPAAIKTPGLSQEVALIPQSMVLTTDFPWARERVDFGSAYPGFADWLKPGNNSLDWYTTRDRNLTVEPGN